MNPIVWPVDLVRQIGRRNVVLFVGAGASMGSQNRAGDRPPSWTGLLDELAEAICPPAPLAEARTLISQGQYLSAAELIHHAAVSTGNLNHYSDTLAELCDGPSGDKFQPSPLHEAMIDLQPSVIVTTNFDQILERTVVDGYTPMLFNAPGIDNAVRQGKNLILKLHGSAAHAMPTILTQSDYVALRREGSLALEVLQSLLLTRMALFVGYSFNDPDLRHILETLYGVPQRAAGHVLVANGEIPDFQRSLFTGAYGLNIVHYPEGNHPVLLEGIKALSAALA